MTVQMRVVDVARLECRLVTHEWRYARDKADEIDRHWTKAIAANPSLYDGRILLACRAELKNVDDADVLEMDFFEAPFSRFLAWRDFGWADCSVYNAFAMPAVRASDGAYLLGEMGPGHSSAGQIYFPGGTPDLNDVTRDGRVDLEASLLRELTEETGLKATIDQASASWTIVFDGQRIACMKPLDWDAPADQLSQRVRQFLAFEKNPELSDVHFLSAGDTHDDPRLPTFMTGYLAHVFRYPWARTWTGRNGC